MDGTQILTLALALYSALLSSVLGYLAWRRDRHSLVVRSNFFFRPEEAGVIVQAVNAGVRSITVSQVLFERNDSERDYVAYTVQQIEGGTALPVRLDDGAEATFKFAIDDLPTDFTAILVRDAFRNEYRIYRNPEFDASFNALEAGWSLMRDRESDLRRV